MAIHDGARQPVNSQSEMSAHVHHVLPPQAQLGSERALPRQVTSPSRIERNQVLDLCVCAL